MLVAFKFTPIYSGRFSTGHLHWMRNLWLIIHNILYNWTTNATQSANTIGISDAAAASSASSDIHRTTTTTRTTITNVWAHFAQFGLRSFLFSILINLPSYIYTYTYIYIYFFMDISGLFAKTRALAAHVLDTIHMVHMDGAAHTIKHRSAWGGCDFDGNLPRY